MAKKTKTTARKATSTKAAKAARGFAQDAKIVVKAGTENPLREGSAFYRGFEAMRKAGTVAKFATSYKPAKKTATATAVLRGAVARGFAKVG